MTMFKSPKQVEQLDIKTGEVINSFKSINEAARENYADASSLYIALTKNNGVMTRLGLAFRYKK